MAVQKCCPTSVKTCYQNVYMQIIQVNLTSEDLQPIASGTKVEFTYSVTWAPTPIHFSRRFARYLDYNFFEHQVCRAVSRLLHYQC